MQQNNKINLEKRSPKRANNITPLLIYDPLLPSALSASPSHYFPSKGFTQSSVRICTVYTTYDVSCKSIVFSPFMFSIVLKVSVRLVKWSLILWERLKMFVDLCFAAEGCVSLRVCENVFLSPARCDPGSRDPNKPNGLSFVYNWFYN